MTVRRISAAETVALRWPVLRAGLPRESAIFPGDELPTTCHFGAFTEADLIGVATIYPAPLPEQAEAAGAWQLRGMAVHAERQRTGAGRALIQACLQHASEAGARLLWCNARVPAAKFYEREGFRVLGEEFEIPTASPHLRMAREV